MRFPFTLMGLIAAAAGVWTLAYLAGPSHMDAFSATVAVASGVALSGLGAYLIYRRLRHGPQG